MLSKRTLIIALSVLCFCALAFSPVLSRPAKADDTCPDPPYWVNVPYWAAWHWEASAPGCTDCELVRYGEGSVDTCECDASGYCDGIWYGGPASLKIVCDTVISWCYISMGK